MGDEAITYRVIEVPLDRIRAFASQPRKYFDPQEIAARAESMRVTGQQAPVTVEPVVGDARHDYELIDGESRWRSARAAGLKTLWCAVRSRPFVNKTEKHLHSLVANFNRSEHTAMEISDALQVQIAAGNRTQTEIAAAIGKSSVWVSQYLALQNLHPEIQKLLHPTTPAADRIATAVGMELGRVTRDRQLEILHAARGADGRVTKLRVAIEIDRLGGKARRKLSPSKRREKIENTVRAIRQDLMKLQSAVGSDIGDVANLLRSAVEGGTTLIEEGVAALQSVQSAIRQKERGTAPPPQLRDTANMGGEELDAYCEEWRQYWCGFPAPRKEYLLLEVAYPHAYRTGRRI